MGARPRDDRGDIQCLQLATGKDVVHRSESGQRVYSDEAIPLQPAFSVAEGYFLRLRQRQFQSRSGPMSTWTESV